jgi:hypothetical protein
VTIGQTTTRIVYGVGMTDPKPLRGHPDVDAWLSAIAARRAAAPKRDEIQEALTAALEAGLTVGEAAARMGIARNQIYQGKYDTSAAWAPETETVTRRRRRAGGTT